MQSIVCCSHKNAPLRPPSAGGISGLQPRPLACWQPGQASQGLLRAVPGHGRDAKGAHNWEAGPPPTGDSGSKTLSTWWDFLRATQQSTALLHTFPPPPVLPLHPLSLHPSFPPPFTGVRPASSLLALPTPSCSLPIAPHRCFRQYLSYEYI